jgi:hypothetical protein
MAGRSSAITQNTAKRIFKAAIQAGFESAKITVYPDGRVEAFASVSDAVINPRPENSWDDVLK